MKNLISMNIHSRITLMNYKTSMVYPLAERLSNCTLKMISQSLMNDNIFVFQIKHPINLYIKLPNMIDNLTRQFNGLLTVPLLHLSIYA